MKKKLTSSRTNAGKCHLINEWMINKVDDRRQKIIVAINEVNGREKANIVYPIIMEAIFH